MSAVCQVRNALCAAVGLAFDFFFSIYEIEAGVDSRPDFWKLRTIFHAVSLVVTLTWGGLVGWYVSPAGSSVSHLCKIECSSTPGTTR
jgi:hypothetical protein